VLAKELPAALHRLSLLSAGPQPSLTHILVGPLRPSLVQQSSVRFEQYPQHRSSRTVVVEIISSIVVGYGKFRMRQPVRIHATHRTRPRPTMQSILARSTPTARASLRTFASSAATSQAVPTEKQTLLKEFKIYRWVS
jgi:3-deoxy-D-manno-octulosonic-acid transferase